MGKWKTVRLGDVTTINMGQSPSSETYNNIGDGLPFFQGKADFGLIHPAVRMYCSEPKKIAENSSILLSVRAPVGAVNIATQTCCIGRGLAAISEIKNVSHYRYLFYYLKYKASDIANMGVGSTFKAISRKDFDAIQLPLPPLDVQQKIADVLDKASALIELRRAQLDKLDLLVKSQFIEVIAPLMDEGKTQPLNSLIEDGRPITYGILKPGTNFVGGIPVVKVKDMIGGEIVQSDLLHTTPEIDAAYQRSKLRAGDLLISIRGSVGRTAIVPDSLENANITQDTARLSIKPEYDTLFVRGVLESYPLQREMERNIRGVAVKGINIGFLRELQIPLPNIDVQKALSELYEQTDKSKFQIQQSLSQLELNYKSLMQKCFRGEVF